MAAAPNVASTPTTEAIGKAFVEQYYTFLRTHQDQLHRFYYETSIITRPQDNGTMKTLTTMAQIRTSMQSFNYTSLGVEILSVDSQPAYNNGLMVLVTGFLTGTDNVRTKVKRKFAQSFFLAPQVKGFYISNDVFRYVDE